MLWLAAKTAEMVLRSKVKSDEDMVGRYYAVGVEVPPRQGAMFSMRYTTTPGVQNIRSAKEFLRRRMLNKKMGMVGEVVLFTKNGEHSVSLGGYIRRKGRTLEPIPGDINRGALHIQSRRRQAWLGKPNKEQGT